MASSSTGLQSSSHSSATATDVVKSRPRDNAAYEIFLAYITEVDLVVTFREICMKHHVTLRDIFLDVRGATVHAARLEVWWFLGLMSKSYSEIGRIFARDATSVQHAMKRLQERAAAINVTLSSETVCAVARSVATENRNAWKQTGQRVAELTNKRKV